MESEVVMARNSKGGFKRRSLRQKKAELTMKTVNRKRNLAGCGKEKHV
jgi:hypothetical protein